MNKVNVTRIRTLGCFDESIVDPVLAMVAVLVKTLTKLLLSSMAIGIRKNQIVYNICIGPEEKCRCQ
jgi:hypothetical protein